MKKSDFIFLLVATAIFLPFFISDAVRCKRLTDGTQLHMAIIMAMTVNESCRFVLYWIGSTFCFSAAAIGRLMVKILPSPW